MELLERSSVVPLHATPGALPSLGDAFATRFCAWQGASGRRYVLSVFLLDLAAPEAGLPEFEAFVLMPVRRGAERRPTGVFAVERGADRRMAVAHALATGADEWHIHLIAEDRAARATVAADLRRRHGQSHLASCA